MTVEKMKFLKELTETYGIPGREERVRDLVCGQAMDDRVHYNASVRAVAP